VGYLNPANGQVKETNLSSRILALAPDAAGNVWYLQLVSSCGFQCIGTPLGIGWINTNGVGGGYGLYRNFPGATSDMVAGPDGSLWFIDNQNGSPPVRKIDRFMPSPAAYFRVDAPTSVTAGAAFPVTVTAIDGYSGIATAYQGMVHFTSSDPRAVLPADYTFTAADHGVHTFMVTLRSQGRQSIFAKDTIISTLTGTAAISLTEFSLATTYGALEGITPGPDGNLWFTERVANKIGRITPNGVPTEFSLGSNRSPFEITAGPDGNLWFTEWDANKIGRITPGGVVTEFPIPTSSSIPYSIVAGPDGGLWFTENSANKIGRIAPSGVVTEFPISGPASHPTVIIVGPDSNLWFILGNGNVGRITPAGTITAFPFPNAAGVFSIVAGPDGNLWVTEIYANKIGRITPMGTLTEFPLPPGNYYPSNIVRGSDGALWFTETGLTNLGRITIQGQVTGFLTPPIPIGSDSPQGMTVGPDGNFWLTETTTNKIQRLGVGLVVTPPAVDHFLVQSSTATPLAGSTFSITITAQDTANQTVTGYTGTVHFRSSDPHAVLPTDYTFAPADNGVHTFTITLKTAGSQTVTATDTQLPSVRGSTTVTVQSGPARSLRVTGVPASIQAGTAFTVTLTALDGYDNVATSYTGTVTFAGQSTGETVPAAYTFTTGAGGDNGTHSFANGVTLTAAGNRTLTVTDPANSLAVSFTVNVTPAVRNHFRVTTSVDGSSKVAGTPFDVTVTVQDAYGNTVTGYSGTITFSSQDPYGATLPPNYQFTTGAGGDNGIHTFAAGATLYTAGTWDVTATDTTSGITGSDLVTVTPAAADHFQIDAPATVAPGMAFDVTVTALDPYGNVDVNYRGTVTFTSSDSDPNVILPADYTFLDTDNGVAVFPQGFTLMTLGDQTITATDVDSGITGSATVTVQSPGPGASGAAGKGSGAPGGEILAASRSMTPAANDMAEGTPALRRHASLGIIGPADAMLGLEPLVVGRRHHPTLSLVETLDQLFIEEGLI
jgi:streptogramin lyase